MAFGACIGVDNAKHVVDADAVDEGRRCELQW